MYHRERRMFIYIGDRLLVTAEPKMPYSRVVVLPQEGNECLIVRQ